MSRVFPMAGFQLTLHGRFWVIPEVSGTQDIAPGAALWTSLMTQSVLTKDMVDAMQAGTSRLYFVAKASWVTNGIQDYTDSCLWLQPFTWAPTAKEPIWHVC
jgi:hypothetical protein